MNKKHIFVLIGIIIFLSLAGTFAWWNWSSSTNAVVNGKVCAPNISFTGGTTINGTDLEPVLTKEQGLKKDINVNLFNSCDNDTAVLNLKLKLNTFPSALADSSFKWALYKVTTSIVNNNEVENETLVSSGNFYNKAQNDVINIANNVIVNQNISVYRLYIWIDGTVDNPYTIGGNSFIFSLYGQGTKAIYDQNVMGDYHLDSSPAATDNFMVSGLLRNSIESIEITKTANIPNGVTSYDISSNSDGSIKLWYVLNPETNLNKVYIGSESGTVKANASMARVFSSLTNVKTIDLSNLDTSSVTSMYYMFYNCSSLMTLNLSNFDTSNLTNMGYMFYNCSSLMTLDLSSFNTSKVTAMGSMFRGCSSLTNLDLSNFDTSKVTSMANMFRGCSNLTNLDLSNFSTSSVTSMGYMFYGCSLLMTLDLSNFNTSSVTNMTYMFYNCSSLTTLDLSNFDTSKVTSMANMFQNCRELTTLNLSNFNTSAVSDMSYMFSGYKGTSINLSSFDTSSVTTMQSMFSGCSNLSSLDLSSFDTSSVTTMRQMFYSCSSLTALNLGNNFDTSNVTSMFWMFNDTKISDLSILSNFNTSKVTNMAGMFYGCNNIKSLDGLQNWDVSKVDYFAIPSDYDDSSISNSLREKGAFQGLTRLEDASAIDNWNIKPTAYFYRMFYNSNNVHPTFSKVSGTWSDGTFTPST